MRPIPAWQMMIGRPSWTFRAAALDLDFARNRACLKGRPRALSGLLSTTRASTAYADNAAGVWSAFSSGVPRITDKGLLVEEPRTTLVPKARRLDDGAVWTLSSVTASAVAGIDGVLGSATRLTATGSNGTITSPTTSLASAARRLAPFIRRVAGTGNIDLSLDNGSSYTTLVGVTSSWQRLGIGQTLANPQIKIRIASSGDAIDIDFAAGETGSFDTSPIESISAAATRAADAITINNFASWFNQSAGTMFADGSALSTAVSTTTVFQVDDGGFNNRSLIGIDGAGDNAVGATITGGVQQSSLAGLSTTNTKVAMAYAANDVALVVNGGTPSTDASVSLPTVSTARIGNNSLAYWAGYLRRIAYFPTRLPNAQLQALTQ